MAEAAPISESETREALSRVLGSEEFRASPNLTAFLRFIVERALEGREDTIKAYSVATEVLGRPDSFDPQVDPIVRVEATRLRRSLERYYGRCADPLVIDIPRGSYVPTFARRGEQSVTASDATDPDAEATPALPRSTLGQQSGRVALVGGLLMMVIATAALGLAWWIADSNRGVQVTGSLERAQPILAALTNEPATFPSKIRQPQSLTTFGTVLVPPIAEVTESGRSHATIITELLRNGLARFEDITVVEVGPQPAGSVPPMAEDTYLLTGRLLRQGPSSKVSLRLRHELSQRIVWSGDFIIAVADGFGLSETAFMRRVGHRRKSFGRHRQRHRGGQAEGRSPQRACGVPSGGEQLAGWRPCRQGQRRGAVPREHRCRFPPFRGGLGHARQRRSRALPPDWRHGG